MNAPVVFFGFILALFSSFGQTHFISLFNQDLRAEFDLSHGEIGAIYSGATLLSAASLIWLGKLIDSFNLRSYTICVMLGLCAAALMFSYAHSIVVLGTAFYLLRLTGQGLSGHISATTVSRYATKHRGLSISISSLGFSIGESLLPVSIALLLGWISWRQIWIGVAVTEIFIGLTLALLSLNYFYRKTSTTHNQAHSPSTTQGWTRNQMLKDPVFWLIAPAVFTPAMLITALFFHQQSLAAFKSIDFTFWALSISAYSVASITMSLFAGIGADRWGPRFLLLLILLPMALACLVIAQTNSSMTSISFFALLGMSQGLLAPLIAVVWVQLYGTAHLGAIRALIHAFSVFSSALGPIIFGLLLDNGNSWSQILFISIGWTALATTLLSIGCFKMKNRLIYN